MIVNEIIFLRFSMSDFLIYNFLLKSKFYFWGFTKIYHAASCYGMGKHIFFSRFLKIFKTKIKKLDDNYNYSSLTLKTWVMSRKLARC